MDKAQLKRTMEDLAGEFDELIGLADAAEEEAGNLRSSAQEIGEKANAISTKLHFEHGLESPVRAVGVLRALLAELEEEEELEEAS